MRSGLPVHNVRDFGAASDGKSLATRGIQATIDACAGAGGGVVYFPPGTYLAGTLHLKSFVELYLEGGATLLGSPNQADYPIIPAKVDSRTNHYNLRSLLFAEDLEYIAISGRGAIDGNGSHFKDRRHDGSRPLNLRIVNCRDVLVENISIGNSGFWNQHYLACERVRMHGVKVWNHATYNVDALDIDACRDFIVSDCVFDSDDDAICLKSTMNRPCENIHISNCRVSSHCNAIKLGTDSTGGFNDVTISNCTISAPRGSKPLYGRENGISGISLDLVDGGAMRRVSISNITIEGVEVPLFVRLGARGVGMFPSKAEQEVSRPVGQIDGITLQNIEASGAGAIGCSITGIPGHDVHNISLANVTIVSEGHAASGAAVPSEPPESVDAYPEATMFGILPAFGLYCRHVGGLHLLDVRLATRNPDESRAALALTDVRQATVRGLQVARPTVGGVDVAFRECSDLMFAGYRARSKTSFVELHGAVSRALSFIGNDFTHNPNTVHLNSDVPRDAVRFAGNVGIHDQD